MEFSLQTLIVIILGLLSTAFNSEGAIVKRHTDDSFEEENLIGCMHMASTPGIYLHISPGNEQVCGFYAIGQIDQIVEIEFLEFKVDCDTRGILATVDGWELKGQFFPSELDNTIPMEQRYQTYCGQQMPIRRFISHQNVAMLQFVLPARGEGFMIKLNFHRNPEPCNSVSMIDKGEITLSNHGRRSNCSVSIIFPVVVELVNVNVGVTPETQSRDLSEVGTILKCEGQNKQDFVELRDGSSLDPMYMYREIDFCGLDSNPINKRWLLGCEHSVVNLVSSGQYYNSVTFKYRPLKSSEKLMAEQMSC